MKISMKQLMVIFLAIGLYACQTENKEQMSNTSKMYQKKDIICLLYTSPSPRDRTRSRMPSSA